MSGRRLIILGSTNPGKLRELQELLAALPVEVRGLDAFPSAQPPAETGASFAENARLKALGLARELGAWVLGDDSGLCVDALNGGPGIHSARYAGSEATDERNVAKLLGELADVDATRRGAEFACAIALGSPDGILLETEGRCRGRITRHPRGHNGFGYDPVFFYPGFGATFAEVSADAKHRVSHRGKALRALAEKLPAILAAHEQEAPS